MANTENEFGKRYQGFSDRKLLEILGNEAEYLPEAIEAARKEFKDRNLSPDEIASLKEEIAQRQQKRINWDWTQLGIWKRFIAWWGKVLPSKKISFALSIVLLFWMFQRLFSIDIDFFSLFVEGNYPLDLSMVYYLLPYLLSLMAIPLLFLQKREGWVLGTFLASSFVIFDILLVVGEIWGLLVYILPNYEMPISTLCIIGFSSALRLLSASVFVVAFHLKVIREIYRVSPRMILIVNWLAALWTGIFIWWVWD